MSSESRAGWRWRNVPVPIAHVAGLAGGVGLEQWRPWPVGVGDLVSIPVAGVLAVVGLAVGAWAVRVTGRQDLGTPSELVTDGPYRYSRNPMYVAWTAIYVGVAFAAATAWPLALLPVVAVLVHRQVRREERALEARFGVAYRRYRRRVRRYL